MAGFCTKCGGPLTEDGHCPRCEAAARQAAPQQTYQQPQPGYQQPQPGYQQPRPGYQQPQPGYQQPQPGYQQPQPGYQQPRPGYQQPQPGYQQPQPGYQQSYQPGYQQPQQAYRPAAPKGPSVWSTFGKNLGKYFKDPVGVTRSVFEKKEYVGGLLIAAATALIVLLGTLFFSLVQQKKLFIGFGDVVVSWLLLSIVGVALAYGMTFGICFVMAKMAKNNVHPLSLMAAVGYGGILPTCFLAVSMLLGMATPVLFEIFAVLAFAAWAVSLFTILFRVMNIKMNILNSLLLIAMMAAAYFVVILFLCWYLFGGDIATPIAGIYGSLANSFNQFASFF